MKTCWLVLCVLVILALALALAATSSGCQRPYVHGADDLQMVIIQRRAGMPRVQYPFSLVYRITDRAIIEQAYTALALCRLDLLRIGGQFDRIALVKKDGRVFISTMMYGPGIEMEEPHPCRLQGVPESVFVKPDRSTIPTVDVTEVVLHKPGRSAITLRRDRRGRADRLVRKIVCQFNPYSLGGCVRYSAWQVRRQWLRDCTYVEAELARPVEFKTLITPRSYREEFHLSRLETRNRFQAVRAYSVLIISSKGEEDPDEGHPLRLAFRSKGYKGYIVTDELPSREFLGYDSRGWPLPEYGEDLWEELLSLLGTPKT